MIKHQLQFDFNPLSREEILMKKLGLKPWPEFMKEREGIIQALLDQVSHPGVLTGRQLGRTTSMLLKALVELEDGKPVVIVGHSHKYSHILAAQLTEWAQQLGIEWPVIQADYPGCHSFVTFEGQMFVDHVVTESK